MTLVADASALYAQADRREPSHGGVADALRAERGAIVTSQLALAEADYLILTRLGVEVELTFLDDVAAGTFLAEGLTTDELAVARDMARRYRDLRAGLADCSLAVLADRHRTTRLLTLDERAFRVIEPLGGGAFTLLPADA